MNSKHRRTGQNAKWTEDALAFLKEHYPAGMPLRVIAMRTQHHIYEVQRMAVQLGLPRLDKPPAAPKPPIHISTIHFEDATFDVVVEWLRGHGHTVEPGYRAGLWKVGYVDAQTPQMVVRLANNRRRRDHGLPPFQVNTGGIQTAKGSNVLNRSLTGSSMTMQLAGLMAK